MEHPPQRRRRHQEENDGHEKNHERKCDVSDVQHVIAPGSRVRLGMARHMQTPRRPRWKCEHEGWSSLVRGSMPRSADGEGRQTMAGRGGPPQGDDPGLRLDVTLQLWAIRGEADHLDRYRIGSGS